MTLGGQPFAVMGFMVVDAKIVEIDGIVDPGRVGQLAASTLAAETNRI